MSRQTIARTATRKIAAIKAQNLRCLAYDDAHDFVAYDTDGTYAWRALEEGRAKLQTDPRGGYTITMRGTSWFRLVEREGEG